MADKLPLANKPAACSQPRWPAGGLDGLREKPPRQEMCLLGHFPLLLPRASSAPRVGGVNGVHLRGRRDPSPSPGLTLANLGVSSEVYRPPRWPALSSRNRFRPLSNPGEITHHLWGEMSENDERNQLAGHTCSDTH